MKKTTTNLQPSVSPKPTIALHLLDIVRDLRPAGLLPSLFTGLVTGLMTIIFAISFAALIFSAELAAFLPLGIGFILLGNAVMIVVVALLSSHASTIAENQDAPVPILVATIVAVLAVLPVGAATGQKFAMVIILSFSATFCTGLLFILLGYFKLGGLVRFLPYPVVGGFLASTGWLILLGAVGLMADGGISLTFLQPAAMLRWLPGLALGITLIVILSHVNHPLTIPGVLLAAVLLFYAALWLAGMSPTQARAQGWLLAEFPTDSLWQFPLTTYTLAQVDWIALSSGLPNLALILVISIVVMLLNVTGVELVVKQDIDLNRELVAAGLGNVVSAPFGSIVGFHSLSLSGLNHRLSGSSRLTSLVTAACCVATLLAGPLVLAFIPKLILGGMLAFLGLSFIMDWVIYARKQFPRLEYSVILLILAVVAIFGFLQGVAVGLLVAIALFVINYSRISVVKHTLSGASFQSRVTRAQPLRKILREHGEQLHILQLQGYLFFGTAHRLLEQVRERMKRTDLAPVRFVVLDFRQVTGLDSTAHLSFTKLRQAVQEREATLIFTELSPDLQRRLVGESTDGGKFFPDLDRGVEWCEAEILRAEGVQDAISPLLTQLAVILPTNLHLPTLLSYCEREELAAGAYLIRQGDTPDILYFVESGQLTAQLESEQHAPMRLETMRGGRVVGEIGFYLGSARTAAVRADEPTIVYRLSLAKLKQMEEADPHAASTLHRLIVHLEAERMTHLIRTVDALLK